VSQISTHVLDTARGAAAAGVPVTLETAAGDGWSPVASGVTDPDGRASALGPESVGAGRYRLTFDTLAYFDSTGQTGFFPQVVIVFDVADDRHCHVPLLLSPFGFSSYRGT